MKEQLYRYKVTQYCKDKDGNSKVFLQWYYKNDDELRKYLHKSIIRVYADYWFEVQKEVVNE